MYLAVRKEDTQTLKFQDCVRYLSRDGSRTKNNVERKVKTNLKEED